MTIHRAGVTARSIAASMLVFVVAGCGIPEPGSASPPGSTAGRDASDVAPYRVVADEDGVGDGAAVVVFDDNTQFDAWWSKLGFSGSSPSFDPDRDVMVGFTATYPSGCEYGFSQIEIDEAARTVEARYYGSEPAEVCAADENPFTVVVAVSLSALSTGQWMATMSVGQRSASFDVI